MSSEIETRRWKCVLCGRNKFTSPGQPHRCNGQFRKRFKRAAELLGYSNAFIEIINPESEMTMSETKTAATPTPQPAAPGEKLQPPKWAVGMSDADRKEMDRIEDAAGCFLAGTSPAAPEAPAGEVEFNVNDYVRVKLTDTGREVIRKYSEEFLAKSGVELTNWPKEDEKGWSKWQLHRLMSTFGKSCGPGFNVPFKTTIKFQIDSLPAAPTPSGDGGSVYLPSVDIVRHEVEELRKANDQLRESMRASTSINKDLAKWINELKDDLAQLRRDLESEKAESQLLRNSLSDALERQPPYDEQVIELTKQLSSAKAELAAEKAEFVQAATERDAFRDQCDELRKQLTDAQAELAKREEPKWEWRDARPEDAGKGYKTRTRDSKSKDWEENGYDLVGHDPDEEYSWKTGACWKFCQVYAPVEPATPQEAYRDLTKHDTYSGPGQVKFYEHQEWRDAVIVATDNDNVCPFIAKQINSRHYGSYPLARVKAGAE